MNLIPTTDAKALSGYIRARPYRSALPHALPDRWIKPLVRDLRQLQEKDARPDDKKRMLGPAMLAIHVLAGRLMERGGSLEPSHVFTDDQMMGAFTVYQTFLEREFVTRAVGIPSEGDEADFVRAVDLVIDGRAADLPLANSGSA